MTTLVIMARVSAVYGPSNIHQVHLYVNYWMRLGTGYPYMATFFDIFSEFLIGHLGKRDCPADRMLWTWPDLRTSPDQLAWEAWPVFRRFVGHCAAIGYQTRLRTPRHCAGILGHGGGGQTWRGGY
jgi:hypothetical protein